MCPSQLTTDSHSIRSNWLLIALHQGIGIWEISYILVSMTTDGVNMQALFRKQYCWCFVGTTSNSFMVDVILKKALWSYGFYYISTPLLQCSSNLRQMGSVADVPTGVMPPHRHLFSLSWRFVDLCSSLPLLTSEVSLMRGKNYNSQMGLNFLNA